MKSDTIREITPNMYNVNCENWLYDFVTDFQRRNQTIFQIRTPPLLPQNIFEFRHNSNNICGQSIRT